MTEREAWWLVAGMVRYRKYGEAKEIPPVVVIDGKRHLARGWCLAGQEGNAAALWAAWEAEESRG